MKNIQNRYQMFDFRRIDILLKSNTSSKIFRTSIKTWQLYSCCRLIRECTRVGAKNYLSNSRGARLRRLKILHKQTNKWVSLPGLKMCFAEASNKMSDDFQFESDKISDNVQCLWVHFGLEISMNTNEYQHNVVWMVNIGNNACIGSIPSGDSSVCDSQ